MKHLLPERYKANFRLSSWLFLCFALVACDDKPKDMKSPEIRKYELENASDQAPGQQSVQENSPVSSVSVHLDGFQFYSGNMQAQVQAHHYISMVNDEFMQAVIYDGSTSDAKLIGIEYIISERLFGNLPPEEKLLWHSHQYEVKSGVLAAHGLSPDDENDLMRRMVTTYGKTWRTWHSEIHPQLPVGIPALMMSFTKDGQLNPMLVSQRDTKMNVDALQLARARDNIPVPRIDPLANAWERDGAMQLNLVNVESIVVPQPNGDIPGESTSSDHSPEPELPTSE